jgi:hypothetical protein
MEAQLSQLSTALGGIGLALAVALFVADIVYYAMYRILPSKLVIANLFILGAIVATLAVKTGLDASPPSTSKRRDE